MPLCTCRQYLNATDGYGKELHRITIDRHMKEEQMDQKLEEEYKKLYPEKDFMQIEKFEQNLDNDETRINLFEDVYDNKKAPNEEDNKEVAFHDNYDNKEAFIYDNEEAFIYDNEEAFIYDK